MLDVGTIVSGGLFQLGYVYPNVAKPQAFITSIGGRAFTRFEDAPVHNQTLRGAPMECRQNLTFGFLGPTNVELVEPIEGRNIYTEFLDAQPAGGLHHIAWKVDDIDGAIAALKALGLPEVQTGCFGAGTRFSYFDLRDRLGHFVELLYFDEETEALFKQLRGGDA
jgi:methylmalonyl-CoA/ethylmalonyl-CoA epimerase